MITHHPELSIQAALQLVGLATEKLLPTALLTLGLSQIIKLLNLSPAIVVIRGYIDHAQNRNIVSSLL